MTPLENSGGRGSSCTLFRGISQIDPDSPAIEEMISCLESGAVGKPSTSQLMLSSFGRPSRLHSFTAGAISERVLIFVLKSTFLIGGDLAALLIVHPVYNHLHNSILKLHNVKFTCFRDYDLKYQDQKMIPNNIIRIMLAAILYYNFHLPSVYRYLQGNYTCAW